MSKIKNGGLDQYGAEPFEQQQFGTAGVERVKYVSFDDMVELWLKKWISGPESTFKNH